ncbi:MAG: sigma-E processing peptidase SpoIIGA [Clostridia bacterium]|nr:sigma-E processing peptidase SpoIIGA [Clostridia bacterium]
MIVYADVLVFLNLIVNYFLLLATSKILNKCPKTRWLVLSAFMGALSSLYIFLPPLNIFVEGVLKILVCGVMCLVVFGFQNAKAFLKSVFLLFGVTVGYGGLMYAVWLLFSPKGMVINNSVVYFNISLLQLIIFTVLGYIGFSVLFHIFPRKAITANRCEVTVFVDSKSINFTAIVDTGNSIEDIFSRGEIIICDKSIMLKLFGSDNIKELPYLQSRYRLLPCSTVSGANVLEGVRCDRAVIKLNDREVKLSGPILAISKTKLSDGEAIINPKVLG